MKEQIKKILDDSQVNLNAIIEEYYAGGYKGNRSCVKLTYLENLVVALEIAHDNAVLLEAHKEDLEK